MSCASCSQSLLRPPGPGLQGLPRLVVAGNWMLRCQLWSWMLCCQLLSWMLCCQIRLAENSDDLCAETEDEEPAMIAEALALELALLEEVPAGGVVAGAVIVFSNNDL